VSTTIRQSFGKVEGSVVGVVIGEMYPAEDAHLTVVKDLPIEDYGRIAYEAYSRSELGLDPGEPDRFQPWDVLSEIIQADWEAAADALIQKIKDVK